MHKNESFAYALYSALINNGYNINEGFIKEFLRSACSWYTPEIPYPDYTGSKWWDNLCGKTYSFCKSNGIYAAISSQICEEFKNNAINFDYKLYDDAETILAYCCANNYRNYLLSNNFPELINTVERFGLDKYFSGYFLSSNIGFEKPHIKIFEYAIKAADNPEFCCMVGDNPVADINGAKNAGLMTILVHGQATSAAPDHVCKELSDIKIIL